MTDGTDCRSTAGGCVDIWLYLRALLPGGIELVSDDAMCLPMSGVKECGSSQSLFSNAAERFCGRDRAIAGDGRGCDGGT